MSASNKYYRQTETMQADWLVEGNQMKLEGSKAFAVWLSEVGLVWEKSRQNWTAGTKALGSLKIIGRLLWPEGGAEEQKRDQRGSGALQIVVKTWYLLRRKWEAIGGFCSVEWPELTFVTKKKKTKQNTALSWGKYKEIQRQKPRNQLRSYCHAQEMILASWKWWEWSDTSEKTPDWKELDQPLWELSWDGEAGLSTSFVYL